MGGRNTSSFRDPSGFIFTDGNSVKRKINPIYFPQFEALTNSGFYELLFSKKYLIPHSVESKTEEGIVLEAHKIPFVSYPYEWSFPQYQHAALLTLKIQKLSLEKGFTLKDASAFNITFYNGKPIFIDTLSFDFYTDGEPWMAYKQFIMHFLGPLVLSRYFGHDFLKTLASEIDGIPLSKLSKLLPWTTKFHPFLQANVHLLARYDEKFSGENKTSAKKLSKSAQIKLIDSLYDFIENLEVKNKTEWDDYYAVANYSADALAIKKTFIKDWFASINGKTAIDMGGNDGTFSRELLPTAELIITADVDANAVASNYSKALQNKERNILPIVADLLNPAAGYGFNNRERFSLSDRLKKFDASGCMALALIHHITLSGNVPFAFSAEYFAGLSPNLLIEFPTRNDSWVQFLLKSKREFESHFDFYTVENFEKDYSGYFEIVEKREIPGAERILYFMKRRNA